MNLDGRRGGDKNTCLYPVFLGRLRQFGVQFMYRLVLRVETACSCTRGP